MPALDVVRQQSVPLGLAAQSLKQLVVQLRDPRRDRVRVDVVALEGRARGYELGHRLDYLGDVLLPLVLAVRVHPLIPSSCVPCGLSYGIVLPCACSWPRGPPGKLRVCSWVGAAALCVLAGRTLFAAMPAR